MLSMVESPRSSEIPAPEGMGVHRTNSSAEEEWQLIYRIQGGARELFYELVRPYERRVYVIALSILRNEADAEDIVQESLLRAFTHLAQFREAAACHKLNQMMRRS